MCEVHGGSFCCRKSVALIQKSTLGFFWCMKFCFWGIAGFFSTLGERYFFFFLSLLISCISKLLILNISEGHIREEVYVAISNSFPCPSISAHARNNTSMCFENTSFIQCILAGKDSRWCWNISEIWWTSSCSCLWQTFLSGRHKYVLRNRTIRSQSFN